LVIESLMHDLDKLVVTQIPPLFDFVILS